MRKFLVFFAILIVSFWTYSKYVDSQNEAKRLRLEEQQAMEEQQLAREEQERQEAAERHRQDSIQQVVHARNVLELKNQRIAIALENLQYITTLYMDETCPVTGKDAEVLIDSARTSYDEATDKLDCYFTGIWTGKVSPLEPSIFYDPVHEYKGVYTLQGNEVDIRLTYKNENLMKSEKIMNAANAFARSVSRNSQRKESD